MSVSISYLWRSARSADLKLWKLLETGIFDEDTVEAHITKSLERAANRLYMT